MKPTFKEPAPPLTGRIREKEASKRLDEVPIVEQRPDLGANVCAHVVHRGGDISTISERPSTTEMMSSRSWLATTSSPPRP